MFTLGFILYSVIFGVILAIVLKKAPLGFEDKSGFHYLNVKEAAEINSYNKKAA